MKAGCLHMYAAYLCTVFAVCGRHWSVSVLYFTLGHVLHGCVWVAALARPMELFADD